MPKIAGENMTHRMYYSMLRMYFSMLAFGGGLFLLFLGTARIYLHYTDTIKVLGPIATSAALFGIACYLKK